MTNPTSTTTTVSSIGVAMFTVADQDDALAFYTEKLGWEMRVDMTFGEGGSRWLEVAPPGSVARLALNPPMGDEPGGGSIGVETNDVHGERERLSAVEGVKISTDLQEIEFAPKMFSIVDPDGNHVWIVEMDAA